MAATPELNPQAHPFHIERLDPDAAGTAIFRLSGPLTARAMYECQTPDSVGSVLSFHSTPDENIPTLNILDITDVPYVDSMGLGMIVTHYAHCQGKGIRMVLIGVGPRVLELFKLTKVAAFLPMARSVEEAKAIQHS
jgi:ABC-type transporter Mla MlaB component